MLREVFLIMIRRMRLPAAVLVSSLPTNMLRCAFYRWIFGYSIRRAYIGFGTLLLVREASLNGCRIGRFNRFVGPMRVVVEPGALIESHNVFDCGEWVADAEHGQQYARSLAIGVDARITDHHFFDVAGSFILGRGSWIAGRDSQFWTHGAGKKDRNISIGRKSYIGSAVRFAPGACVGDNVVVGIGSVVTKPIEISDALIAGCPARVVKQDGGWCAASGSAERMEEATAPRGTPNACAPGTHADGD